MRKRTCGLLAGILLSIGCSDLRAQEATPAASPSSISPDKQWEFECRPYGNLGQCAPAIVKAATDEQEVDLDGELGITGPAVRETEVVWAPDSKRFACNYSPPHPHRFTVVQVAFYQLKGDQWERVEPDLTDEESSGLQLAELGKGRLPKGFNPAQCSDLVDVLKVRSWPDASRAVVYAPCHGRGNRENTGLLFTVKFDDAGKWRLVETRRMSEKELTEAEE